MFNNISFLEMLCQFLTLIFVFILGTIIYHKNTNAICKSKRRLEGKTAVIVGGTKGMGLEIAMDFAHRGAKVIIACPLEEEGLHARSLILKSSRNENVSFKLLDLASLESVRRFSKEIIESENRLDLLINNAGVGFPGDSLTDDGMNFIMQVNYFGIFLVTILLLPLLKRTGTPSEPSKIINTTSRMHNLVTLDLKNLNNTGNCFKIYSKSKLCILLFTYELAKRLKGFNVVVNCVDPGIVGTGVYHSLGWCTEPIVTFICLCVFKNQWEGAQTAIHAAICWGTRHDNGKYFRNCRVLSKDMRIGYDDKTIEKLWEESVKCVKLKDEELSCLKN